MTPGLEIRLTALRTLPEVAPGNDVAALIHEAAARESFQWQPGLVVVVAQKIVSKSEGQVVDLAVVEPSARAREMGRKLGKDDRLVEVILRESRRVVRCERGVLVVETHHGWVCANAGVDQSNVPGEDCVTLLPRDPDASAERLRAGLHARGVPVSGVVISDTFGRPWRNGLANVAIGVAGLAPLEDYRGQRDRQGRLLKGTVVAVADEVAAAAELLMGKADGVPVVMVSGLRDGLISSGAAGAAKDLIRPEAEDLFR
jgi:coenzyme F420-0:L-glutamate ligase / coenzyme F420-1:gamma-L-glutamate ligase